MRSVAIMCFTIKHYNDASSDCITAESYILSCSTSHKFNIVQKYFLISVIKYIQLSLKYLIYFFDLLLGLKPTRLCILTHCNVLLLLINLQESFHLVFSFIILIFLKSLSQLHVRIFLILDVYDNLGQLYCTIVN